MKREKVAIVAIIMLLVVFLVIFVSVAGKPKREYDEKLSESSDLRICYDSVNVRAQPNENSEIIDKLSLGDRVSFTGNMIIYPLEELEEFHKWYEVAGGGWITADAVTDDDTYKQMFGGF